MGFGKSSDFAIVESEEMFLSADLVEMEKLEKEAEEVGIFIFGHFFQYFIIIIPVPSPSQNRLA